MMNNKGSLKTAFQLAFLIRTLDEMTFGTNIEIRIVEITPEKEEESYVGFSLKKIATKY
ncbi:MAG: hypothetical protein QXX38_03505 [Candidatus Aenigmatarchaeota archaeon]